ncbi:MAG: DUF655 domain-containing protein [Desulfurococcales archaeon]|nr:DUF655 domain-containing protein [Desulfurococcales archaeon]
MQPRRHGRRPSRTGFDPATAERMGLVLDFMPFGNRRDPHKHHRKEPVVQVIGFRRFTLLDGIPLNFTDIDFLEKVSLLSEMLKSVIRLSGTRRSLVTNVILSCYKERDHMSCFPVTPIDEEDYGLLLESFEEPERERVRILREFGEMEDLLESRGLPRKAIRVPPTPLSYDDLTPTAKENLPRAIEAIVRSRESEFVEFFNIAEPINVRLHAIELLPGIGKKTLRKVLQYRNSKRFESFDEVHKVAKVDPVQALVSKILEEIKGEASYYLFVRPREPNRPFLDYLTLIARSRR